MPNQGLHIAFDFSQFGAAVDALRPPAVDRAIALALVDTAKAAISQTGSAIAKHTGMKAAYVKQRLHYDRVPVGKRETYLRSSRKRIPIHQFGARQTAAGVSAAKPWGQKQQFKSAFVATMPTGHTGVFRRKSGAGRLPIRELWGPSIYSTFEQPEIQAIASRTIRERLPVLLARRINAEARRAARRKG